MMRCLSVKRHKRSTYLGVLARKAYIDKLSSPLSFTISFQEGILVIEPGDGAA